MTKRVSVAEARQNFARIIERARRGDAIEITRHGEAVAVILSAREYETLTGARPSFSEAVRDVRERYRVEGLEIDDDVFEDLRDQGSGRKVDL